MNEQNESLTYPIRETVDQKEKISYYERWKNSMIVNVETLLNVYDAMVDNPDSAPQQLMSKYVTNRIEDRDLKHTIKRHLDDLAKKRNKTKIYQQRPEKLQEDITSLYSAIKIGENSRVEWHDFGVFIIVNKQTYESLKERSRGYYRQSTPFMFIKETDPLNIDQIKKHELFHLGFDVSSSLHGWGNFIKGFQRLIALSAPFSILEDSLQNIISRYYNYTKEEAMAQFVSLKSASEEDRKRMLIRTMATHMNSSFVNVDSFFYHTVPNNRFLEVINILKDYVSKNPDSKEKASMLLQARKAQLDQERLLSLITKTSDFLSLNYNSQEHKRFTFFFALMGNGKLNYCESYLREYQRSMEKKDKKWTSPF